MENKKIHRYDVIVVGAGHAGLEAAFICTKNKLKVALITLNEKSIGSCPCNPSVGGPAKGIVTREIDALGGMQGKAVDYNQLQMKMLNSSKGPGVRALRAQIDKILYHEWFLKEIKKNKFIDLIIDEVKELIIEKNNVIGVKTEKNIYYSKKTIITSGTYMNSLIHIGLNNKTSGPVFDYEEKNKINTVWSKNSQGLSDYLKSIGLNLIRLKTGTPPRIYKDSIDFERMQIEPGTNEKLSFEHYKPKYLNIKKQQLCYLTYTNELTHKIIKENIHKSAMYSGNIKGVGPRYCPSIEDKIIRFSDKLRHQLFIEPESLKMNTYYLQGLSTSLPEDIQEQFVHTIVGLEHARFQRYAYAIEYDAIDPTQLNHYLETKKYNNLYFAGQINGTSGYEEAACQGLIAGINASLSILNKKQIILKRNESYIGVLIDDIITKGVIDPYRLLTSRAEYRLLLRNDNAEDRLIKYAKYANTISKERVNFYNLQTKLINKVILILKNTSVNNELQIKYNNKSHNLYQLLKVQNVKLTNIVMEEDLSKLTKDSINKIEILVKIEGYLKNQEKNIENFLELENFDISGIKNFNEIKNLSNEAIEKLNKIRPINLNQIKRIQGITTNDILCIKYYIDTNKN